MPVGRVAGATVECNKPWTATIAVSTDFKHQLALKMTRFAYPMRVGGVCELIADESGWTNGTRIDKIQHSFEMSAIANDIGA